MTEKQINDMLFNWLIQTIEKIHNEVDFENYTLSSIDMTLSFLDKSAITQCHAIKRKKVRSDKCRHQ